MGNVLLDKKALNDFAEKIQGIDGLEVTEDGIRMKTDYGNWLFVPEPEPRFVSSLELIPGHRYRNTDGIVYSSVFDVYEGEGDTEGKEILDSYLADGLKISDDGEYIFIPAGTVMEYYSLDSGHMDGFKINGNEYDFYDAESLLDILEEC